MLLPVLSFSCSFIHRSRGGGANADVTDFHDYLINLRAIVKKALDGGKTGDVLVNAALPALKEKYGKWNFFEYFAKPNILDMAAELRGDKKIPHAPQ